MSTMTPERTSEIRAEERARCVAELRTHSEQLMAAAVDQVIANNNIGIGATRFAASMARAAQLLESGELSTPPALSSLPDTNKGEGA